MVKIDVAVVLHSPIEIKRCISIKCELTEKDGTRDVWYHIPCIISLNSISLELENFPFWSICPIDLKEDRVLVMGNNAKEEQCQIKCCFLYGSIVAVKEWQISKAGYPRDFIHEKEIYLNLAHENLVTFIGASIDEAEGKCSLVIEYCPNNTVDDYIQKNEVSVEEIVRVALATAKGMQYMHCQNLIHRDLKSRNILLDDQKNIKICDFGEASFFRNRLETQKGTPGWMAPEVLTKESYTSKADVYSFGVFLWQLCTKQQPSPILEKSSGKILPVSFPPNLGEDMEILASLGRACLQTNPAKRPTFLYVFHKLEELQKHMSKKAKNLKHKQITPKNIKKSAT